MTRSSKRTCGPAQAGHPTHQMGELLQSALPATDEAPRQVRARNPRTATLGGVGHQHNVPETLPTSAPVDESPQTPPNAHHQPLRAHSLTNTSSRGAGPPQVHQLGLVTPPETPSPPPAARTRSMPTTAPMHNSLC